MKELYKKKIFNFKTLKSVLYDTIVAFINARSYLKKGFISHDFAEKIMLVITVVNDCVYCSWFHNKQAIKSGVAEKDLFSIFNLDFDKLPTIQVPALSFAVKWAENNRVIDIKTIKEFEKKYSFEEYTVIYFFMNAIYLGNLAGNTFDAFISRFKGKPAKNSSFFFELIFFIFTAPVLLPILPFVKRKKNLYSKV